MNQFVTFIVLVVGIVGTIAHAPQQISGGSNAGPMEFTWQVSLRNYNSHFCGGAIIGSRHILTAAHCVYQMSVGQVTVVIGTNNVMPGSGDTYWVKSFEIHPEFVPHEVTKRQFDNDIAVITLTAHIEPKGNRIHMIYLPSSNVPDNVVADVSGFGLLLNKYWRVEATIMQKLRVSIVKSAECEAYNILMRPYEICVRSSPGVGVCDGDSGGPLVYNGTVVGIVSMSFGTCANGKPDIFTRVYYYLDFIYRAMVR